MFAGSTTTAASEIQRRASRDHLTSQSRRHARHSADDVDVMTSGVTSGVTPSSAVTFKSAASYVVTRVQLFATFSIYFKVISRLQA